MQDKITKLFKAIADPTRRDIFHALVIAASALSITQISNQFEISRQGVTKHIKTLEDVGLVKIDNKGRERFCYANAKPLKEVNKWIEFYEQFWGDSLDKLEGYLNDANKTTNA
jgi:DNA-binding transcriptional ArsR family regulator